MGAHRSVAAKTSPYDNVAAKTSHNKVSSRVLFVKVNESVNCNDSGGEPYSVTHCALQICTLVYETVHKGKTYNIETEHKSLSQ